LLLTETENHYFQKCAGELLQSRDVRSMSAYTQHADVSCLEHSISVAYTSYWICEKLHLRADRKSLIRGALLHDFFLYDWHLPSDRKGLHGFTHPKAALKNAEERFRLNGRERDIIVKHMWPLTPVPPKCKEAFIVGLADKYCSLIETLRKHPAVVFNP
jgi:uncharacterized protein